MDTLRAGSLRFDMGQALAILVIGVALALLLAVVGLKRFYTRFERQRRFVWWAAYGWSLRAARILHVLLYGG
jgi:hypothetical protein